MIALENVEEMGEAKEEWGRANYQIRSEVF